MKKLIALFIAILVISTGVAWFTTSRNESLKAAVLPKEITVYTTVSNAEMQYIANSFKTQTGITVNYQVVDNLQQAVEQNKGKVDFVYGGTSAELDSMASAGLLEKSNFNFDSDISDLYKGKNGYWYGTSIEPIVMFYNSLYTNPKDAPQNWADLANENYKGKVILNSEYKDFLPSIMASMDSAHAANNNIIDGQTFESQLNANDPVVATNPAMYLDNLINNKERSISFAPMNEVQNINAQGHNLTIINPTTGSPLTIEGAAIVNGSKNLNADQLFMEFVAGPKVQLDLANQFNVIPVSQNALTYSPAWMKSFNNINICENDWNLLNNGQFEANNKNNPQIMDSKKEDDAKNTDKQAKKEPAKPAESTLQQQIDQPLNQANGAKIILPPGTALTAQEKAGNTALAQLQQEPSQAFQSY
ncbi:MAG: extracellular solute-binding protein [Sarcina sp.]